MQRIVHSYIDDGYSLDDLINFLMEGVPPEEVRHLPLQKAAIKYTLITASVIGGLFQPEVFDDPEAHMGKYLVELECLIENKAGFRPKAFEPLTTQQWEIIKSKEDCI